MKSLRGMHWLLLALAAVGLTGWILTGLYLYARLTYFVFFLTLSAALLSALAMRGVDVRRSTRTLRASVGEILEEHFEVRNRLWPGVSWLEVANGSDLPLASGSRVLTRIGARQRRLYVARSVLTRRGAFQLGPTVLTTGDPFGVFSLRRTFPGQAALVVLPMTFPILDFPPPPGLLPGGKAIRQRTSDVTPHAAGIREYVPGDPMKRIHWPSTARRQRFMVKEFEQDPQANIWIFLDAQREVQASLPDEELNLREDGWLFKRPKVELSRATFEYGVSAAASLAGYFLARRRMVGLACSTARNVILSAERGERQLGKIMEALALVKPDCEMPIGGLIGMQAKLLPLGTGVILITPNIKPDLLLAVEDLQRRNLRPVVVLIDAESFGGMAGSSLLSAGLLHRSVPACQLSCGDDLSVQLALPALVFQRSYLSRANFSLGF